MVIIQMVNHILIARIFLIGLVVIAIFAAVTAQSPDEVSLIPCVFHTVTDVPCPGCGMTRACLSITHGQFTDAWRYHPLSFLILGLAIAIAIYPSKVTDFWLRQSMATRNYLSIFALVICLSVWIVKLKSTFW